MAVKRKRLRNLRRDKLIELVSVLKILQDKCGKNKIYNDPKIKIFLEKNYLKGASNGYII